jgi:hypothetical protein
MRIDPLGRFPPTPETRIDPLGRFPALAEEKKEFNTLLLTLKF